jgi:integrase
MSFARWLADTRYQYGHEYRSVLERLPVPKTPASNRQAFTPAELDEVWVALEQRPNEDHYRAIAFVRLLWAAGLRRGEALALRRTDLRFDKSGGGWVPAPERGSKGNKQPRYLDRATVGAFRKYFSEERKPYIYRRVKEPLFITEQGKPFTPNGFGSWLQRIAEDIRRATPSGIEWSSDLMSHTWKFEGAQPIRDSVLRRTCEKFLRAVGDHDQAVREACVVLEDRVREVSGGTDAQLSSGLMEWAFGGASPRLRLAIHPNEQRGTMELYRGITAFYRGGTAHRLRDDFDPNEALRIVLWIDHLLGLLAEAVRAPSPAEA